VIVRCRRKLAGFCFDHLSHLVFLSFTQNSEEEGQRIEEEEKGKSQNLLFFLFPSSSLTTVYLATQQVGLN
jgi:hypothetical protein